MIIQNEEDQNIEFKESWNSTELLKWVCGFANAKGGRMYIGVRDDGEVLGLSNSKKLMEDKYKAYFNKSLDDNGNIAHYHIVIHKMPEGEVTLLLSKLGLKRISISDFVIGKINGK